MVDLVNKYNQIVRQTKISKQEGQVPQSHLVEEEKVPPRNLNENRNNLHHEGGDSNVDEVRYNDAYDNDQLIDDHNFQRSRSRRSHNYGLQDKYIYTY